MKMPRPGDYVQGKYQIVETLGEGGFAHVFRARDLEVGRDVAIKVLRPRNIGGYDPEVESRFTREARVIASLQDSHTITMYEFGKTDDGLMFMVFEFVEGRDLAEVLKRSGPLPPPIAEHILRQLLSALGEAHANGVLHRDIKPANVIVFEYMDDPWRVKLLDFGIAKPLPQPGRDHTQLTKDGAVIGTPRYMAPEQFFGEELTPRTDVYGLGLLAYELLAGRPAIEGGNTQDLIKQAVSAEELVLPPVPGAEGLSRVVHQMVRRDDRARFPNADAVVAALNAAARQSFERAPTAPPSRSSSSSEGYPTAPRHGDNTYSEPVSTGTRAARTRSLLLFGAGLVSLTTVGALGVLLNSQGEPSPPMARPVQTTRNLPFVAGPTPATPKSSPTPVAEPVEDMSEPDPADGCGLADVRGGFGNRIAKLGFRTASYTIYVPIDYDPNRRHEVVMLFHNALGNGRGVIEDTRYDEVARREGLVLIAPDSTGDSTRPWYAADDVELVRVAYEQTRAELCLDDQHVYGLGHGGGGNFVMELRCQFAMSAIAFTATGEHTTQKICDTDHPVPTMRLWGNTDKHVPAAGGEGCWDKNTFRSAQDVTKLWRERNGAEKRPRVWKKEKGGICKLHEGKAPYIDCEMYGGHDWPTAPAKYELPGCAAPPPDFPIGETILEFFKEHGVDRHDGRPDPDSQ